MWFAISNVYLSVNIITTLLPAQENFFIFGNAQATHWVSSLLWPVPGISLLISRFKVNNGIIWVYIAFVSLQFFFAVGNRPKAERKFYWISFLFFAIIACELAFIAHIYMSH